MGESQIWTTGKIDKLGEQLKPGSFTPELLIRLDEYRSSFATSYSVVVERLRSLDFEVTGRPAKSTSALVDKLNRQHVRLTQVQDIAGCRIVVGDTFLQDKALPLLEIYLGTPQVIDRRESPSSGYRAIHLISNLAGRKVEVQLRTELQHL